MMKLSLAAGASALALSLSGCAAFTTSPTSAQCTSSQNVLAATQLALTSAETTLAALQAAGVGGPAAAALEAAVPVYQAEVTQLEAQVTKNCAVGAGLSTPIGSVGAQIAPSPSVSAHVGSGG